jgi:hypothetical protein
MIWLAALFAWLPVVVDHQELVPLWLVLVGVWVWHHCPL